MSLVLLGTPSSRAGENPDAPSSAGKSVTRLRRCFRTRRLRGGGKLKSLPYGGLQLRAFVPMGNPQAKLPPDDTHVVVRPRRASS